MQFMAAKAVLPFLMSQEAEQDRSLHFKPVDIPASTGGVNHLLVIGIDAYLHHPRLNNARRDAEAFRSLLTTRYQFDPGRVIELYDEQATLRRIIETLESLERSLRPTDNLLIYFSGHGTMNAKKSQGFWVPVDAEKTSADYLPNDRVRAMIGDMEAHHIYLIVDACFSGSMILRSSAAAHELLEQNPSRRVLTSGRQEVVSDGKPGGHSPFFDCIRHQLSQGQPLSAIELENYVIHNTPRTANQLPEADFILGVGDQSGKFVFHPKRDEARDWADAQADNSPDGYRRYLEAYPQGGHAEEASWQMACLQPQDKRSYRAYLDQFPWGIYARAAIERIEMLDQEARYQEALRRGEAGLRRFLMDYPDGSFAVEARAALDRILAAERDATQREDDARRAQALEAERKRQEAAESLRKQQAEEAAAQEQARLAKEQAKKREAEKRRLAEEERPKQPVASPQKSVPELPGVSQTKKEDPSPIRRYWVLLAGAGAIGTLVWAFWPNGTTSNPGAGATTTEELAAAPAAEQVKKIKPPEMVLITGGSFAIESEANGNPGKPRKITVGDFSLGKYEVTQAAWRAVMGDNPSYFSGCDECPVEQVSWEDVQQFIQKLNQQTGQRYRLPTEAEWEYAAGGGSGARTLFAGTNDESSLGNYAWYDENSGDKTHPVGQKQPNGLGLYDMSGNVWEWCEDDWHQDFRGAPANGSAWVDSPRGSDRVLRGGGWVNGPVRCRVAYRNLNVPGYRDGTLGFRLAR